MLSIAVCDDEIVECSNIAKKIRQILQEMEISNIIRQFGSGQELLNAAENFDIIFLDIIMCGLNGMRTAQLFRKRQCDKILIFMSASRKYVFDAYEVEAFQYLLKPIDDQKLKAVLQRAIKKTISFPHDFIIVNKERQSKKLFLDDIYYFEIKGRTIDIHGTGGIFTYYEQLSTLEQNLQSKGFFRCHKSCLINLKYVSCYNRQEVTLDNGEKIAIAKRRYDGFCKEVLDYMRGNGGII